MTAGIYARVSTHDQHTLGMQIDVIVVWKLDLWSRLVNNLFHTLNKLNRLGVGVISLIEALDLTTATGGLLAIFAEFEREILRERVKTGIAHARSNDKRHGRPATAKCHSDEITLLFKAGLNQSEIARRLSIGRTSVRRILNNQSDE